MQLEQVVSALAAAGFLAPHAEADALLAADGPVEELVARRLTGEPLAWVVGHTTFLGRRHLVHRGVYVPRHHTEALARHAAGHLRSGHVVVDLCCGAGVLAAHLASIEPTARALGVDIDPVAVACAAANGVEAVVGDLFEVVPAEWRQGVDLIVSVPPYVPDDLGGLLPADVVAHEPGTALFGGDDGLGVIRRLVGAAPAWLAPDGVLAVEVGVDQVNALAEIVTTAGLEVHDVIEDDDGDPRGICARVGSRR